MGSDKPAAFSAVAPLPRLRLPDDRPPRILIVRLSSMGDLVFATPLLRALRARWPDARIGWLARPEFRDWLAADPDIDAVHVWRAPKTRNPLHWWRALRALRAELKAGDYDLVIEAQGLLKSRVLARLAGRRAQYLGFASKEPGACLLHQTLPKGGDDSLLASEYRYFAEALTGASAPPRLVVTADAAARAAHAREEDALHAPYAVLCPYTTRPQKHWFDEHWIALAPRIEAELGLRCVVLGGPGERAQAEALLAQLPAGSINRVGRTTIAEACAWIGAAQLVVGVDTGLTHIGAALSVPTVALFGSTRPYLYGGAGPLTVLYDALPCAPCGRHPTCGGAYTCLRQLTPARVIDAARALLAPAP